MDIDEFLFGNYGKDWLYGQLAFPTASGLPGPIAKENFSFALEHVLDEISLVLNSVPPAYALLKMVFNLAFGSDEFETNLRECLSRQPQLMEGVKESVLELREQLQDEAPSAVLETGQRMLGGFLVSYVVRGGRYGKQILEGKSRSFKLTEATVNISYNIIMASLGAAIRCVWEKTILVDRLYLRDDYQVRIKSVEHPTIVQMLITAITGTSEGVDGIFSDSEKLFELMNAAGLCYFDDLVELATFRALLEGMRDGGTGALR